LCRPRHAQRLPVVYGLNHLRSVVSTPVLEVSLSLRRFHADPVVVDQPEHVLGVPLGDSALPLPTAAHEHGDDGDACCDGHRHENGQLTTCSEQQDQRHAPEGDDRPQQRLLEPAPQAATRSRSATGAAPFPTATPGPRVSGHGCSLHEAWSSLSVARRCDDRCCADGRPPVVTRRRGRRRRPRAGRRCCPKGPQRRRDVEDVLRPLAAFECARGEAACASPPVLQPWWPRATQCPVGGSRSPRARAGQLRREGWRAERRGHRAGTRR
jgi:hypothetical protein